MRRLWSEYDGKLSADGSTKKYLIEIHEEGFSGADEEIKCEAVGGNFKSEAKAKDFPQGIIPTHAEVTYIITTTTALSFFEGLGTISESGLILKILDRETNDTEYIGKIIPDLAQIQDQDIAVGIDVKIKAVDGLALLKEIPYIDTQARDYFFQINDHKLKAEISADVTQTGPGSGSSSTLFDLEREDPGNRFDPVTGEYISGGVTADWSISLIVHARPNNDFEDVTGKIIKVDSGGGETILAEEKITFRDDGVTQRQVLNVSVEDVDALDTEIIKYLIEWQDDWHFLTFEKGSSFYNFIRASKYALKNVYDKAINHVRNLLHATDLQNEYDAGQRKYLRTITTWNETTRPNTISILTYLNLPFNAFITDYSTYPVKTLSCYDCLNAICVSLGALITYYQGRYQFIQYDCLINNTGVQIDYGPDVDANTSSTYSEVQTEPKRLAGGNFSYLPSIRELSLSFRRWNTPNFLFDAWNVFPNSDGTFYTNNYVKSGKTVKWVCALRVYNNPLPYVGFTGRMSHTFTVRFKIGDNWMKFDQLTHFTDYFTVRYPGTTFIDTTWETNQQINTLMFPFVSWAATPPIDLIVIGQQDGPDDVFDAPPDSGELEFEIEYNTTYHKDSNGDITDTVLALNYEWTDFQFLNTDEADNIIEETVRTSIVSSGSSKSKPIPILFSDRTTLEQDPGKLKIDFPELQDVAEFSDGTTTAPFQEFLTRFYASLRTNRIKEYNGATVMSSPKLIVLIDTLRYMAMRMNYSTVMNEQRGSFMQLSKWAVTGDYFETIGETSEAQGSSATLPGSSSSGGGPTPTVPDFLDRIITGTATLNDENEHIPANYDLKLLDGLEEADVNKKVELRLSGRVLNYPTHYDMDLTGADGKWTFPRPIRPDELLTWRIIN